MPINTNVVSYFCHTQNDKRTILWFRKGLRMHDNPALLEALSTNPTHLYPIFISDPWFYDPEKIGVNRINFLLESLRDLQTSFEGCQSRLLVLRGKPEELLPKLIDEWGITNLVYEHDTEPYAKARDEKVKQMATQKGVAVSSPIGAYLTRLATLLQP